MISVDKQFWTNAHQSRCEFLEVVGITSAVNIEDLEGKVYIDFNRMGVSIKPDDAEAGHRICNDKK